MTLGVSLSGKHIIAEDVSWLCAKNDGLYINVAELQSVMKYVCLIQKRGMTWSRNYDRLPPSLGQTKKKPLLCGASLLAVHLCWRAGKGEVASVPLPKGECSAA